MHWPRTSPDDGRRPVYLAGLPFSCLGSYQIAVSQSIYHLIFWRFVQNVGMSGGMSLGAGVIGDIYKLEERGFAMGVFYGASLLGPAIAPLTGGKCIATHYSSWRMLQWGFLIYGLALLVLMVLWLPETSHPGTLGIEKVFDDQNQQVPRCTPSRRHWRWISVRRFSAFLRNATRPLTRSPIAVLLVPLAFTIGAKYGITNEALIGAVFIPCGIGNVGDTDSHQTTVGAPLAGLLSDRIVRTSRSKCSKRSESGRAGAEGGWYPEDRLRTTLIGAAACVPLSVLLAGLAIAYVPGRTGLIVCLGCLFLNGIGVRVSLSLSPRLHMPMPMCAWYGSDD
ncbi:hypothetical protein PC9H_000190 [Pleurotus ostreatus]|uniref:Major facilitator superfamily (MFS) profile domain-containing protein n=1 Tax=Pleurotus ostreatus TaxID=5322 RepID=A0A8H7DXK7_PLEOS|nr:uncharacterized protein PC9H_000190 [Pleurotus ostreatus]KAF7439853.1 hypothetical protein PC9H_000190 [Pleurotus ostreatus]